MNEGKFFNERLRQIGFLLGLIFLACLIIAELRFFASAFLGGFTIYIILRKPHAYLQKKAWNNVLATAFLVLITLIFLVLLGGGLFSILYSKVKSFGPQAVMSTLQDLRATIMQRWDYDIFSADVIQKALSSVGNILPGLLSVTGGVVINTLVMLLVVFFLLLQRTQFEQGIEAFIPLSKKSIGLLKNSVHSMVMMNAVGIPLILTAQAVLSGLAYWLLGVGDPVVWGLMTGLCGLIPVVGTPIVWLPLSVELMVSGNVWQGIVLAAYGLAVISIIDYGARMIFMNKIANLHPLVILFGVILGMKMFGFWGIIFGPLLISGFFLLIWIYNKEFIEKTPDAASNGNEGFRRE